MNILNLSLGGLTYVPASEDAQAKALTNAIAAGVVVVVAAGNLGPGAYTLSNPGNTPDAITVGAISSSRKFVSQLRPTGPGAIPVNHANIAYVPGGGIKIASKVPATVTTDVSTLDGNGLACDPLASGSLTGKIAFIARGTCCNFGTVTTTSKYEGSLSAENQVFRGCGDCPEITNTGSRAGSSGTGRG
jgi:hypothetical protein